MPGRIARVLVKVGDTWRVFDLPKNLAGEQTAAASVGYFFQASFSNRPEVEAPLPKNTVSAEMQKLLNPNGLPEFEACATSGQGVFETLKAVARGVLSDLKKMGG